MSFLEDLRAFLRHPVIISPEQMAEYRRYLLSVVDRAVKQQKSGIVLEPYRGLNLSRIIPIVTREVIGFGVPPEEMPDLVRCSIAMMLGEEVGTLPPSRQIILKTALKRACEYAREKSSDARWREPVLYLREVRAIRASESGAELTPIGRACLELVGVQQVRWLLHVEVALSAGLNDPWRIDRATIAHLAEELVVLDDEEEREEPSLNGAGVARLHAFGVLEKAESGPDEYEYRVHEHGLPILQEVASGDSPMAIAVAAMIADDVASLLPGRDSRANVEVAVRQSRLMIHELRNALVPVQDALGRIDRVVRGAGKQDDIAADREIADRGIARVLAFASEWQEMSRLVGEAPEPFDAGAAVREAIASIEAEFGRAPPFAPDQSMPAILGVRHRFVLAVINLLRNAYQAASDAPNAVSVELARRDDRLWLAIDDDGPGVPPDRRETVFSAGYSTRAAGTGQGLTLARQTIEGDMRGTLTCEDGSALGGGRFVITLPFHDGSPL